MARNKVHKSRFKSKHALNDDNKGRQVQSGGRGAKSALVSGSKERSKQAAIAQRDKRSKAVMEQKRIGSFGGAPRIVGVVPANESGNAEEVVRGFCGALEAEDAFVQHPFTVESKERKTALTFICEKHCIDQDSLDAVKVSDVVVLVLDASQSVQEAIRELQDMQPDGFEETGTIATTWFNDVGLCITDYTRDLIAMINAQGSPSVVVVLQNLHSFTEKQAQKVLKVHQRFFLSVLNDTAKVFAVRDPSEYDSIVRHIEVSKVRQLKWRDQHPYFPVEDAVYDHENKRLTIVGHLRGMPLSATQLMHLTNHGTYQISSIAVQLPRSGLEVVDSSTEDQRESLQQVQANATLEDDGMPTEADVAYLREMDGEGLEGNQDLDAAWEGGVDQGQTHEGKVKYQVSVRGDENEDAFGGDAMSFRTAQTDVDFLKAEDIIRLERMTDEERALEIQKLKDLSEEEMWNSDMVDTPVNIPARQRFAKYRGLKSFHTGKWDPAENLPAQYAYIYKLQGYTRIRTAALEKCADGPAQVGQTVHVTLEGVPPEVWENKSECVMLASGQLEHEQKWSVLHFQLQRSGEHDEPVKSKTPMLAHIGFRKFYVSPLFSDVTSGDRSKFARFFHETERFRMATFFGPITYNPCPILLFQVPSLEEQNEGNSLRLACYGSALPPNPDTLVLKRAVLTGRVAVIHKKQIVVKYMFFNEDDVKWFQPVDLYTKLGRRGKIMKAVGTHGLFKAALNDQVMQHDVVCMDLYKRVFPKWTTVAFNVSDVAAEASDDDDDDDDDVAENEEES